MTCKHARPAEHDFFKTTAVFFAVVVPFVVLPFLVISDFIPAPRNEPLYVRFRDVAPAFSQYSPDRFP
ncbi:MAG: hypothetical protein LBS53_10215, partial [Synergistaceae bacterium]|nr:hypothetical protein [Synergistaceae bacterium]